MMMNLGRGVLANFSTRNEVCIACWSAILGSSWSCRSLNLLTDLFITIIITRFVEQRLLAAHIFLHETLALLLWKRSLVQEGRTRRIRRLLVSQLRCNVLIHIDHCLMFLVEYDIRVYTIIFQLTKTFKCCPKCGFSF